MHLRKFAVILIAALALVTFAAPAAPIDYPKTKKVEQVHDYHGTKVADPYRWLETDVRTSKDVADWVAAENKVTFDYLGTIPEREPIRKQLTTLWNYEKYTTPYKRGGRYFFSKNNGLQNQNVYYHRLGTPQSDDAVVYYDASQPEWNHGADVTEDGRYLIITTTQGTANKNQVHVRDLQDPYAMPVAVVDKIENDYSFVGNDGPVLYFRTDLNAPKGRLIAIDLRNPARESWKEIVPESDAKLQGVDYIGHRFVVDYLRDAHSEIRLFDTGGRLVRTMELDGIGSAGGFSGRSDDNETFYTFSSYATPPSIYPYAV